MLFLTLLATLVTVSAAPRPRLQAPTPHNYIAAKKNTANSLAKRATGGVKLCTGVNYNGSCDYVVWPLNECINLQDYAGHTLSFLPDEENECLLMQGRCNANEDYADLTSTTSEDGDLSGLPWIMESQSYMCLTPLPV